MDLVKLIQTLEEFVYEIALWPILLPWTFINFAFPASLRLVGMVNAELDKPADQRYSRCLSPILYCLLVAVVPTFAIISRLFESSGDGTVHAFSQESIGIRFTAILIFLIWPPLTMAIGSLLRKETELTREALRRPFYGHCMLLLIGPRPIHLAVPRMAPVPWSYVVKSRGKYKIISFHTTVKNSAIGVTRNGLVKGDIMRVVDLPFAGEINWVESR
jgi:hypothetical protein